MNLMPRKRTILETLDHGELQRIADEYELEVADRRVKDNLVEAVAHSKKAKLHEILETLSRDALKDMCRNLKLDDTGREKAVLIERITGDGHKAGRKEARQKELPAAGKLTFDGDHGHGGEDRTSGRNGTGSSESGAGRNRCRDHGPIPCVDA